MGTKPPLGRLGADQFRKIRQSPALFLACCCVGRALRSQHLLRRGRPTIVVLIAEAAMNLGIYEKAAALLVIGRPRTGTMQEGRRRSSTSSNPNRVKGFRRREAATSSAATEAFP